MMDLDDLTERALNTPPGDPVMLSREEIAFIQRAASHPMGGPPLAMQKFMGREIVMPVFEGVVDEIAPRTAWCTLLPINGGDEIVAEIPRDKFPGEITEGTVFYILKDGSIRLLQQRWTRTDIASLRAEGARLRAVLNAD